MKNVDLYHKRLEWKRYYSGGYYQMTFGNRLYELRKSFGLSQEELAELLDVSRQSVSKWESDKGYPEMTRLIFLSDYFGVSLDYLMRGEEKEELSEQEKESLEYHTDTLMNRIQIFLTNLNDKQKKKLQLLYVLIILVLVGILYLISYELGYHFGRFLYSITH